MDKHNNNKPHTTPNPAGKHDSGTFKITGDWVAQSELLKEKFPQLTDSDLKYEQGQEIALLERVETKLNKQRGEVINIIRKGNTEKA
jgi:hypothetical protein